MCYARKSDCFPKEKPILLSELLASFLKKPRLAGRPCLEVVISDLDTTLAAFVTDGCVLSSFLADGFQYLTQVLDAAESSILKLLGNSLLLHFND